MISVTKTRFFPPPLPALETWRHALRKLVKRAAPRREAHRTAASADQTTLTQGYLHELKALRAVVAESPIAHGYGGVAGLSAEAEGTDPVAALIEHALTGVAGDPAFRGNDHAYTVRVAAGDAPFGLVVTKVGDD